MYIRPNGTEQKIRPTGWQPGANTIAYRPLTDNLNDIVGGYDLTSNGSDYSFTTNSQGKKCLALNLGGATSTTYLENSSVHTQLNQSGDFTFALKIGEGVLRLGSWTGTRFFNFDRQCNIGAYNQATQVSDNGVLFNLGEGLGFDTATGTLPQTYNVTDNIQHSCIVTLDRTNGVANCLVDGTVVMSYTQSGSTRTMTTFNIGKDMYDNDQGRYVAAKISHCVIESGVWDSQRIADYNNL